MAKLPVPGLVLCSLVSIVAMVSSAAAQQRDGTQDAPERQLPVQADSPPPRMGQTAEAAAGKQVGQRQTREQAAAEGIRPLARLDSRIQNRVQSRIRNRIDRNYDPNADAASPFAIADEQVKTPKRGRR